MSKTFDRALGDNFIAQLKDEATKEGWWADVLADPSLFIGLRGDYLNVYWRGQALFTVRSGSNGLTITTHEKYLVDPQLAHQVGLVGKTFAVDRLAEKGFIRTYDGKSTLAKMKTAAGLFSGLEKTGCHEIAVQNSHVIDCEITFPGVGESENVHTETGSPRVDLACLKEDGADARLVFWEAKHFDNSELRADDGVPKVCRQVNKYRKYLSENRDAIERSYIKVAKNLVAISAMGAARPLSQLIGDVASGKRRLSLGDVPQVGLVIFGFDEGQRDHPGWKAHLQKLKGPGKIDPVRAKGDVKGLKL